MCPCCIHVVADRVQTLQDGLPLFPVQLPQERPQPLDERILQQRFAIRFRDEEAVQSHVQRFRDFFERAETGRHLPALGHRPRFAKLADPLTDVLHRLLIRELRRHRFWNHLLFRRCFRNQVFHPLRQCPYAAAAVAGPRAVLDQTTSLAANHFPIHFQGIHSGFFFHICGHRYSLLTGFFRRADRKERRSVLGGEDSYWREGSVSQLLICCQEYFSFFLTFNARNRPCLRPVFACPFGRAALICPACCAFHPTSHLYVVLSLPPTPPFRFGTFPPPSTPLLASTPKPVIPTEGWDPSSPNLSTLNLCPSSLRPP